MLLSGSCGAKQKPTTNRAGANQEPGAPAPRPALPRDGPAALSRRTLEGAPAPGSRDPGGAGG